MFLLNIRFVILILMSDMLVYFSLWVSSRSELDVPMNAKSFRRFFRFWNTWTRKSMQGNTVTQTQIWNSNITKWKNMVEIWWHIRVCEWVTFFYSYFVLSPCWECEFFFRFHFCCIPFSLFWRCACLGTFWQIRLIWNSNVTLFSFFVHLGKLFRFCSA